MPHIIVEHTSDIAEIPQLLRDLHNNLGRQDTVNIESLKTRAICLDHVVIGNGDTQSMMHITLRLLPGRDDVLLQKMTTDLEAIARQHCSSLDTRITVESIDLYKPSYKN